MNDPLKELGQKIKQYQEPSKSNKEQKPEKAIFIATEIVAGTAIGGTLGYYIDQFLGTKVLFLLIFIILGLISSLYNIYKKNK